MMHNVDALSIMRATYTAIESTDPNEHITAMIYSSLEMSRDFICLYAEIMLSLPVRRKVLPRAY